jgi:7,8-dihydropterin-6-yl-methyl-4-(beta-D-ribofuranosyl)aminobenzene 5'-phosphate synthase
MNQLHDMQFTILVDDTARGGLKAEHGFSCLVEADTHRVLFDTGANDALLKNSVSLGVELNELDALVFSHGHYDHTGGLGAICDHLGLLSVFAHPNIIGPHRSRRTGHDRDIGTPKASRVALDLLHCAYLNNAVEVADGIWTTGEIPRATADAHSNELWLDTAGMLPDRVEDDMALVLRHQAGLVVLLGCAHAGVLDTLAHVERLFPGQPLLGVIGGMHLYNASVSTINAVIAGLRSRSPLFVAPGHCTGAVATQALLDEFGPRCIPLYAGMRLHIGRSGVIEVTAELEP